MHYQLLNQQKLINQKQSNLKNTSITFQANEPTTLQAIDPLIYATNNNFIGTLEKDNSKTYAYDVAGMKIKCEEEFVNKTESMRLIFSGKGKVLDEEITFKETIYIDTDTYDRYDWNIKNGILYVTLYEKINPRPDFKRVDKPARKTAVEEENK